MSAPLFLADFGDGVCTAGRADVLTSLLIWGGKAWFFIVGCDVSSRFSTCAFYGVDDASPDFQFPERVFVGSTCLSRIHRDGRTAFLPCPAAVGFGVFRGVPVAAMHRPLRVRLAWACCRSLEPLCCPALRGRGAGVVAARAGGDRFLRVPPRPSASALWTSWRQIPLLRLVGSPVTPSGPGGPSVCLSSLFTFLVDFGRCFIYEPSSFSRRQGTGFSAESSGLRVCEALLSLPRAPFPARSRAQCPSPPVALASAPAPASLAQVSGSSVSPPWVCPLTGVAVKPRPSFASSRACFHLSCVWLVICGLASLGFPSPAA